VKPASRPGSSRAGSQAKGKPKKPATRARSRSSSRSLTTILSGHSADLWGVALVTIALLAAIALFGDSLGPAGHGVRLGMGYFFGAGRFALPPAFLVAGVLLIAGRSTEHEPVRATLGLGLTLWAISGLAAIAGGAPGVGASQQLLAGAGGWLGATAGDPLRAGLGSLGASVVLLALIGCALVVLTGSNLRSAAVSIASALRRSLDVVSRAGEAIGSVGEVVVSTDPRRRAQADQSPYGVAEGRSAPAIYDLDDELAVDDEPPAGEYGESEGLSDPPVSAEDPTVADGPSPLAATPRTPGPGRQLQLELGLPKGEWRLPHVGILARSKTRAIDRGEVAAAGRALVEALAAHGVATRLVGHTVGPTVTRYELELGPGVKVARVTSLAKDIAYAMASPDVRILAPIPGKSAIGIEVPNRNRQLVTLGDVLSSEEARDSKHPLEVAIGRDIAGRPVMANLADMPHILISGATGAGKSSCINSLLTSILMRSTPEQVRLILVDPKRVELGQYNGLPHLLTQVVVDPKKAANALSWAVTEMERRYDLLAEVGMRDITGYNQAIDSGELGSEAVRRDDDPDGDDLDGDGADVDADSDSDLESESGAGDGSLVAARVAEVRAAVDGQGREHTRLPFVLVVVDELNDLMMVAARDVEESVCRIAQMARAVGIHLVLATQRPSVDVITGVIKANIPSRLAFSVSSLADSRVILDQPGAERLIGKGDMLLLTASSSIPRRIQGPWVAEEEIRAVAAHWRRQSSPDYVSGIAGDENSASNHSGGPGGDDELLGEAMELVVRSQLGSTSMLQRRLRVGFSRAGRLMDLLERQGVVGPSEGSKARSVLMTVDELDQVLASSE
jgi:DNA segregation ATPase FtsK/SpoIIIE, S-DNA-T family